MLRLIRCVGFVYIKFSHLVNGVGGNVVSVHEHTHLENCLNPIKTGERLSIFCCALSLFEPTNSCFLTVLGQWILDWRVWHERCLKRCFCFKLENYFLNTFSNFRLLCELLLKKMLEILGVIHLSNNFFIRIGVLSKDAYCMTLRREFLHFSFLCKGLNQPCFKVIRYLEEVLNVLQGFCPLSAAKSWNLSRWFSKMRWSLLAHYANKTHRKILSYLRFPQILSKPWNDWNP